MLSEFIPARDGNDQRAESLELDDIYRGERPEALNADHESIASISSSSSSSSPAAGRRLGAVAAALEAALNHWARRRSFYSHSSSSSSSVSVNSSITRKRRRQSDRGSILAQASVLSNGRVRQELRQIPRNFVLYLPPSHSRKLYLAPGNRTHVDAEGPGLCRSDRVIRTTSLPSVIHRLELTVRKSLRPEKDRSRPTKQLNITTSFLSQCGSHSHHDYMLPEDHTSASCSCTLVNSPPLTLSKKGKQKANSFAQLPTVHKAPVTIPPEPKTAPKAWWLDVASPTWEDMRAIGKLLHLHPLTLEDILHQDPREKVEHFPRLGYYFIVFRAIDSRSAHDHLWQNENKHNVSPETSQGHGTLDEANLYLVVFRDGICSFHFSDVSEHTDRARNRILLLEETAAMSSDWIAHGILDSVVDSFLPLMEEIEAEVLSIDNIVFDPSTVDISTPALEKKRPLTWKASKWRRSSIKSTSHDSGKDDKSFDEKSGVPSDRVSVVMSGLSLPLPRNFDFVHRIKTFIASIRSPSNLRIHVALTGHYAATNVRRMARTRRLVTSLSRLLATKSEVIAQIRKRLLMPTQSVGGFSSTKEEDLEVAMYMGDIHDHILTLQLSLSHYEQMLSQSHPIYLSQLRITGSKARSGTDLSVMLLTCSSMGVLCIQTLIGLFSMNVTIPANGLDPGNPYYWFGVVLSLAVIVLCAYLSVVRLWWVRARRRRGRTL